MRVVVICEEPDRAPANPDSIVPILADLGCRVELAQLDLADLDQESLRSAPPTIVILETGDRFEWVERSLRAAESIPALAETPRLLVVPVTKVSSLDFSAGFDDFLLSPVVPAELYARLRQLDWKNANFGSDEVVKVGDLVIDLAGYEVHLAGRKVEFTHQEFELLSFLAQNRGRVFTRDHLLKNVWGYQHVGGTRTVDIHVRRLRAKLGSKAAGLIVTVRNVGYKMRSAGVEDDD